MRLVSASIRLAAALALFAGVSVFAPPAGVRADGTIPAPFDLASIDRSKNACSDFFAFATGKWRAAHPIPAAYREYGYIEALVDHTRDIVRAKYSIRFGPPFNTPRHANLATIPRSLRMEYTGK